MSAAGGAGPPRDQEPEVYATTRHGRLSLQEIAGLMPGLGSLMPVIADRYGWMVHAARGGNWPLARYQLRKIQHLFRVGRTTRPKWAPVIDAYMSECLDPLHAAIDARDLPAFERASQHAVDDANRIHGEYGYGYIHYRVPERAPEHMDLGPPPSEPE